MIRILIACSTVLLSSCADQEPSAEVRRIAERFIQAENADEINALIFLPTDLDEGKSDRIKKECQALLSGFEELPKTLDIKIMGRWARVGLSKSSQDLTSLTTINIGGKWRIFWDPSGAMMWGKQEWHTQLSDTDWADYKALQKH